MVLCFISLKFYSDFSNWCYFIVLYNCMSDILTWYFIFFVLYAYIYVKCVIKGDLVLLTIC